MKKIFKAGDIVTVTDCIYGHQFEIGSEVEIVAERLLTSDYACTDGQAVYYLTADEIS